MKVLFAARIYRVFLASHLDRSVIIHGVGSPQIVQFTRRADVEEQGLVAVFVDVGKGFLGRHVETQLGLFFRR